MLETSARLLRVLSLFQARRAWTGAELAERLEVTERTVRRDVDRLRSLGYPVHATSGVAGGYSLGAGSRLPPLLLDDDEALAVAIGLRTAAAGSIRGIDDAALRSLTKLEQVLPERVRRRVAALQSAVVPAGYGGPPVDGRVLATLAAASRDRERVTLEYRDRRATATERAVEPHGLVHAGQRWYLVAWDTGREDFRTFRVDRIARATPARARFVPRPLPEGDLATYVSRSTAVHAYAARARVVLHAPVESVRERVSPIAGMLTPLDEARCELQTGAQSLDSLALWIAMLGVEFEVLEPPELLEQLERLVERLTRAVRASTPARRAPARAR